VAVAVAVAVAAVASDVAAALRLMLVVWERQPPHLQAHQCIGQGTSQRLRKIFACCLYFYCKYLIRQFSLHSRFFFFFSYFLPDSSPQTDMCQSLGHWLLPEGRFYTEHKRRSIEGSMYYFD